jgi:hypothetical protein
LAPNVHLATVLPPLTTDNFFPRPFPAGYCYPPTAGLAKIERGPISTIGLSLYFSMSPNRAIRSDRSNFSSPHAAAQPWGGRGHPLSGTRETWVARFVGGYANVNRCRTQSPALPCTLHPPPDLDPDPDFDTIALVGDSWQYTDDQEYEEDEKAEGATHFWHPGNVCGPVGGPYRPAERGRTEATAPRGVRDHGVVKIRNFDPYPPRIRRRTPNLF